MAIVWIVEQPTQDSLSFGERIAGQMAVRRVATLASLKSLLRIEPLPQGLIICLGQKFVEIKDFIGILELIALRRAAGDVQPPLLALIAGTQSLHPMVVETMTKRGISFWQEPVDEFQFCRFFLHALKEKFSPSKSAKDANEEMIWLSDSLVLDCRDGSVFLTETNKEIACFSPKEAKLMQMLIQARGRLVLRETIGSALWPRVKVSSRTMDSHVSRLRKKLEDLDVPMLIESQYGKGYLLVKADWSRGIEEGDQVGKRKPAGSSSF